MSQHVGSKGSGSRVWIHAAALTGMAAFLLVVGSAAVLREGDASVSLVSAMYVGILSMPAVLFGVLPIIAGISLGVERVGDLSMKVAWSLIAGVTLLMVFIDILAPVRSGGVLPERVAITAEGVRARRPGLDWSSVRAIPTVVSVLRGEVGDIDERLSAYPSDYGRVLASFSVFKLGLLLTPLSVAGILLGILGWVDRRVIFRSPRDESLARIVMAWAISPTLMWAIFSLSNSAQLKALFSGQPFSTTLLPHVPFDVLGVLAIRQATRSAADVVAEEAVAPL